MASMVATCFTLQPTLHPRLAFNSSLFPNPRPLKTFPDPILTPIFQVCFSAKLQEPRVLVPVSRACLCSATGIRKDGDGADFKGGRSPSWRPRAVGAQSDHETSSEPKKNIILQFVESIRSFMFGDGDPNRVTKEERWKLIGQYITSKGGVVAAEELAPYLDPLETKGKNDSLPINDETYMLPVLMRYEGHPVIEEDGNVLYRFISLQPTAKESSDPNFVKGKLLKKKFFMENKWWFSKASTLEKAVMVGFGGLCWKGILMLTEGLLLETPIAPGGYVTFFSAMLPVLQACVISITAIPSLRFVLFCIIFLKRNADIKKRNVEDMPVNVYGTNRSTSYSTNRSRDLIEDI
ncbi:uncharacterized protein At5g03900, chloroplastic-like [Rosa rugosa]|uniref:uncharacterized protein At5g03900, chloroplastic-like n=1 Tax=Rosa rugosa TaxID=74645 RepID=UPI002B4127FD|nr:uncharacterized protein At5g03900, chloroplastic-like [Rosa rugosa]